MGRLICYLVLMCKLGLINNLTLMDELSNYLISVYNLIRHLILLLNNIQNQ